MVEEFGTMLGLNNIRLSIENETLAGTECQEKKDLFTLTREFTAQLERVGSMSPECHQLEIDEDETWCSQFKKALNFPENPEDEPGCCEYFFHFLMVH